MTSHYGAVRFEVNRIHDTTAPATDSSTLFSHAKAQPRCARSKAPSGLVV